MGEKLTKHREWFNENEDSLNSIARTLIHLMHDLFVKVWRDTEVPKDCRDTTMIHIRVNVPGNYMVFIEEFLSFIRHVRS